MIILALCCVTVALWFQTQLWYLLLRSRYAVSGAKPSDQYKLAQRALDARVPVDDTVVPLCSTTVAHARQDIADVARAATKTAHTAVSDITLLGQVRLKKLKRLRVFRPSIQIPRHLLNVIRNEEHVGSGRFVRSDRAQDRFHLFENPEHTQSSVNIVPFAKNNKIFRNHGRWTIFTEGVRTAGGGLLPSDDKT